MNKKKYFDSECLSLSLKRTIKMMFPPVLQHSPSKSNNNNTVSWRKKKERKEEDDIAVLECRSFFCAGCITVTMGLQLQNAFTEVLLVHCFVFPPQTTKIILDVVQSLQQTTFYPYSSRKGLRIQHTRVLQWMKRFRNSSTCNYQET